MNVMELTFDTKALEALYLMEKTSNNLFLTGKAGTGKSTLLRQFIAHTQKNIAVLAPTGVAALNVGGSTIHSFFQIPPVVTEKTLKKEAKSQIGNPKFTELDAIVIDEISMVRADLFDHINRYLQIVCKNKKPFGGIQMLLIGDLYQLPPVVRRDEAEFFRQTYASPYFFSSNVVTSGKFTFTFLELETVYRQQDQLFLSFLNAIRTKNLTTTTFDQLNQQVVRTDDWEIAPGEMYLAGKNDVVDRINLQKLEELPGEAQLFLGSLDGVMREHILPTETELWLKVGAQVMFVVNDPKGRWVNGTLGVITDMKHKSLTVQIFGGEEVQVTPHIWKVSQYVYDEEKKKLEAEEIGSFSQIPLRLAWACTIHKSQGKTFDHVIIDLQGGAFAHGQAYVALSRCKTLKGIKLIAPLDEDSVILDSSVADFILMQKLQTIIALQQEAEILYRSPQGPLERRKITPLFVGEMQYAGQNYLGLKAFCHAEGQELLFSLRRILEVFSLDF